MPKGLRLPIGVNDSGGLALVESEDNDTKIIRLALGDDSNENAFQQNIGMGVDMIFDTSDTALRGRIQRRLLEIFRRFESQQRYILRQNTIQWKEDAGAQELRLSFRYLNIESNEEKLFRNSYTSAGVTSVQS